MNCEFCGSSIPAGATSCPACGAACPQNQPENQQTQTAAGIERICVFCGAIIADPNAKECPKCHFSIACKCGKVFKSPRAVCSQCKQNTEAFSKVMEHMRPAKMKAELQKDSIFAAPAALGLGLVVIGLVVGLTTDIQSKKEAFLIMAGVGVFFVFLSALIFNEMEKKINKKYPEFQTTLKMLENDKAFFQAQFQEYLVAERAKAEAVDED